ncbi:MAG: hypothetical protein EXR27_02255 [Betaproteobacteria bacterium]|nr:hypothetical protein [Betaproteobacteria bacterium]
MAFGALAVFGLALLQGCGEKEQIVVYKQGKYHGKLDEKPWAAAQWSGNKAQWETALKDRSLNQNEYTRTE